MKEILSLGQIAHIYKIGELHGVDVPFQIDRFEPKLWGWKDGKSLKSHIFDHFLDDSGD